MKRLLPLIALAALSCLTFDARAAWPDRPIKWVVPFSAGGANDLIARAAAEGVSKRIKQPVIIENKPGAGAAIGAAYAAE
jgi:tripartite-type tricarboxylate transporter receptor subunit TctC